MVLRVWCISYEAAENFTTKKLENVKHGRGSDDPFKFPIYSTCDDKKLFIAKHAFP